ncbi:MAG: iron ABC transporter permease [Phycisphaeraceae bacterium]|nr:iron ABC transporter permease [Phycisphaeraceae bacterium]MCW5754720.1 iron ABC transporter permease [Phycisphaeraceae bacterium]
MSPRAVRTAWHYGLLIGLLLLLSAVLLYPIWLTIRGGFAADPVTGRGFTLDHVLLLFRDTRTMEALGNSFKVAATTTTLAILIALPLAVLGARCVFPFKKVFSALILVPLILPPFVGAIGVRAILGRAGALNALLDTDFDVLGSAKFWGVVALQALSLYPIIYLNATAALANLDPALDEAGESLGAGWWRRFRTITLPLIRPGLFAGATIVFIWSFTELGTPLMFDYYQVTPVQIFRKIKEVESSAEPYALVAILLACAVGAYVLGKAVFGGKAFAMYSKASRAGGEVRLKGPAAWAATGAFALVTFLALTPHCGVILMSLTPEGQWYRSVLPESLTLSHFQQALSAGESFQAIKNSLKLASMAVVVDLLLGLLIAYMLVRTKVRGRSLLDALCMLPLAVPGLVLAFGYVAVSLNWPFGKGDPLEGLFSVVAADPNPIPLLVIAYAIRRLPYIVRSTVAGLEQTSGELEEAAMNLGASRMTAVRKVIVPLIAANLIAGALLVFSFSMLEVSDSLILAQQAQHYPVTKAILAFAGRLADGPYIASAMGVWGMALLTVTLVGASVLLGKKLGSIFRV